MKPNTHLSRLAQVTLGPGKQVVSGRAGLSFREVGSSTPSPSVIPWVDPIWPPPVELPSVEKVTQRLSQSFDTSSLVFSSLPSDRSHFEQLACPLASFRDEALKAGQAVPDVKQALLERLTAGLKEAEDLLERFSTFLRASEPLLRSGTGVLAAFIAGWLTESLFCGDDETWKEMVLKGGAVVLASGLAFSSGVAPFWIGAAVLGGYVTATAKRKRVLEKTGDAIAKVQKLATVLAELAVLVCKVLSSGHRVGVSSV